MTTSVIIVLLEDEMRTNHACSGSSTACMCDGLMTNSLNRSIFAVQYPADDIFRLLRILLTPHQFVLANDTGSELLSVTGSMTQIIITMSMCVHLGDDDD